MREVSDSLHLRRFCVIAIDQRVPAEQIDRRARGLKIPDRLVLIADPDARPIRKAKSASRPSSARVSDGCSGRIGDHLISRARGLTTIVVACPMNSPGDTGPSGQSTHGPSSTLGVPVRYYARAMMVGLHARAVEIRTCSLEDLPIVLELWKRARSTHAVTPDRAADVERLLAQDAGAVLVAESAGEVVGALIAAWDGWRGNMHRLAVHPDRRREGIALRLIRAGEEYLRHRGARRITALVAHDDRVAGAVWFAAGYAQDRQIVRRVRNR